MTHIALRSTVATLPTPSLAQRERLRRRLQPLSRDTMPVLGLVQVEDHYVERHRGIRLMTIYLLLSGPATGEFFKIATA